jgi:hypothetical protein
MHASVYIVDINKHISGCVCVLKGWVYLREPEEVVAGKYRNPPFVGAGIRFGSSAYERARRWGTTLRRADASAQTRSHPADYQLQERVVYGPLKLAAGA